MSETLTSVLTIQYNYFLQLREMEDLFFYVTWFDCRTSNKHKYEVHIEISRYVGPRFKFNTRFHSIDSIPSEERCIEFIRKVLIDCEKQTYEIKITSHGTQAIECKVCGMTSHHPMDVKYRWCARCETFHFDFE